MKTYRASKFRGLRKEAYGSYHLLKAAQVAEDSRKLSIPTVDTFLQCVTSPADLQTIDGSLELLSLEAKGRDGNWHESKRSMLIYFEDMNISGPTLKRLSKKGKWRYLDIIICYWFANYFNWNNRTTSDNRRYLLLKLEDADSPVDFRAYFKYRDLRYLIFLKGMKPKARKFRKRPVGKIHSVETFKPVETESTQCNRNRLHGSVSSRIVSVSEGAGKRQLPYIDYGSDAGHGDLEY